MQTIVLDRDGVINEDSDDYIKSADEWSPIPGSLKAISLLHRAGLRIAVATNQSGLARGLFDEFSLAHIHQKMCREIESQGGLIDGIFYCPHGPDDSCQCRKPKTGLLQQIETEFSTSLQDCYFLGDSLRDLQAGASHGLKPVLVRTGKGAATEQQLDSYDLGDTPVFDDLLQAVLGLGIVSDD